METKYYKYYDNDYQRKTITNEELICDENGNPVTYGTTEIHNKFESGELTVATRHSKPICYNLKVTI